MGPHVKNRYHLNEAEKAVAHCVDIQRGTPLGNPFHVGVHGTREQCISLYRDYLVAKVIKKDKKIMEALKAIEEDSFLVCTCHPKPCHGDIVREIWIALFSTADFEKNFELFLNDYSVEEEVVDPEGDGKTHINVYSKGKTKLGRMLSNFARTPFTHPKYGRFESIEGLWYYLMTGKKHEDLRNVYGFEAKKLGQVYSANGREFDSKKFIQDIKQGILAKFDQNEEIREALRNCDLPLTHYYSFGEGSNAKVVRPKQFDWMIRYWHQLRESLHGKAVRLLIAGSRRYADRDEYFMDLDFADKCFRNLGYHVIEIVSGKAKGADRIGELIADKYAIPVKEFPANWKEGKGAGMIRNKQMVDYLAQFGPAAKGLFFWNGVSNGSAHMQGLLDQADIPYIQVGIF